MYGFILSCLYHLYPRNIHFVSKKDQFVVFAVELSFFVAEYTRKDENNAMIDKRKRMLERFLVRIGVHPILSQEHVFHRFIHGNESWVLSLYIDIHNNRLFM